MNKQWIMLFLLVGMVFSSQVIADKAVGITVHPHIGWSNFSHDSDLKDDRHLGIGIGYQFDSPWAVELVMQRNTPQRDDRTQRDGNIDSWRMDGIYHFNTSSFTENENIRPYLSFGLGRATHDYKMAGPPGGRIEKTESQFDIGAGFKLDFSPRSSLRTDIRLFRGNRDDQMASSVSLGLHHVFGADRIVATTPTKPKAKVQTRPTPPATMPDRDTEMLRRVPVQITLDTKFDFDSAVVRIDSTRQIAEVARFMKQYMNTTARLEGHTDDRGSEDYNLDLSLRRARAVAYMLTDRYGIAAERLTTKGWGESQPKDTNKTEAGQQNNRRVEALIEAEKEVIERR